MNALCRDLTHTGVRIIMLSERLDILCLVDAVDYDWLTENNWNVSWGSRTPWQHYAKRNVGRERATVRMHREIMKQADPRSERFMARRHVDHRNGQTLDNRRCNLRWVTNAENCANKRPRGAIPSVQQILADLLAEHGATPVDIPF